MFHGNWLFGSPCLVQAICGDANVGEPDQHYTDYGQELVCLLSAVQVLAAVYLGPRREIFNGRGLW